MQSPIHTPRKRRTRQHIIADLSVHYVEGLILEEGHTAERTQSDYGYDLTMWTFDQDGYPEPDFLQFQIKASDAIRIVGEAAVAFDVDLRDYNLWNCEKSRLFWYCTMLHGGGLTGCMYKAIFASSQTDRNREQSRFESVFR